MRWKIRDFEFDGLTGRLRQTEEKRLARNDSKVLKFLIENFGGNYTNDQIIAAVWQEPVEDDGLYKSIQNLRTAFGGERDSYIIARPYQLVVKPEPISDSDRATNQSVASLDAWKREAELTRNQHDEEIDRLLPTPIGNVDQDMLFTYLGGYASAIRLYGRGDARVSPTRLSVKYEHMPYEVPQELEDEGSKRIDRLTREAKIQNKLFFNGPNVRLLRWHHNQQGAAELDTMELVLGPVGWYDFEGTNGVFRERLEQGIRDKYDKYVDIDALAEHGDIQRWCTLSNIIGNAITIFSSDGRVAYQKRGKKQSSVPGLLTSAVAENVNRYKDDVDPLNADNLLNPIGHGMTSDSGLENEYRPKGIPHPLAAVRRGIQEEVSPKLMDHIRPTGIKLTGLAFGLDDLCPDALWIVLVDSSASRILKYRRDYPGKDAFEGKIRFVPATFSASATRSILSRPDWVPAGKASLIRSIQLIDAISPGNPIEAFDILNAAH